MSPHLPSAELQLWPEFCSLLKNNWGQRGGSDVTHHQLLALLVLQRAGRAARFGTGMMWGRDGRAPASLCQFWREEWRCSLF